MSRWQVAARLARREVRRHWVRSLLVVAIVAIPLGAAQAAAINGAVEVRGSSRPLDEGAGFDTYGGSDESVGFDPRLGRPSEISPPGTESGRPVERVAVGFSIRDWTHAAAAHRRGPDGLTPLTTIALVDDDVEPIEGRLPRTRHEAVISPALARTAGLDVGDDLQLIASQVDLTVVGVVDHPFDEANAAVGPLADGEEDWAAAALARIRDVDQDQVQVWAEMYELFWWDDTAGPGTAVLARSPAPGAAELVVAAVAGTIAVGFVAVTSSAAFAISARRQVRQLGILAAAGAGPGDLTRAVLLQGSTLGLVGAIVATVLVYAGRAVAVTWVLRPAAEDGPIIPLAPASVLGLAVLGVVAGTLAALVPALTASRIPVLAALAGRRPVPRRRMWSPWVGGVVLAGGLVTLGAVTVASARDAAPAGGETAAGAALAVLAVMGGATALSPAVIAAVARLTGRARGTARLAGRSLSRDRMRSSAVVAASAVALGLPVVLILWQAHDAGTNWYGPLDGATEEAWQHVQDARTTTETITTYGPAGALDDVDGQLREILGPGTVGARTIDVQGEGTGPSGAPATAVDPEELRRATGDDAVADLLAQGALVRGEGLGAVAGVDGARPVRTVDLAGLDPRTVALLGAAPAGLLADDPALSTTVSEPERTYVALGSLDADEVAAIDRLDARRAPSIADLEALRPSADGPIEVSRRYDGGRADRVPWELIAVGLAVLLALLVISVALALSAADGRSDEQVIAAIGAPPSAVRRRRALEAALTAAGAAVLGAGVAGAATMIAIHSPALSPRVARTDIRIPFVDLSLAVVLPVVAIGGLTWLVLATGDRLRGRRDLVVVDG